MMTPTQIKEISQGMKPWLAEQGRTPTTVDKQVSRARSFLRSGLTAEEWMASAPSEGMRHDRRQGILAVRRYALAKGLDLSTLPDMDFPPTPHVDRTKTYHKPVMKFITWLRSIGRSDKTVELYKTRVGPMIERGLSPLEYLSESDSLHERAMRLKAIRAFCIFCRKYYPQSRFARSQGLDGIKVPEREPPIYISQQDAARYRSAMEKIASPREYAAWLVAYGCGLRAREIVNLTIEQLNLASNYTVTIRHSKGGKSRIVPLISQARAAILVYMLKQRDKIIAGHTGPLFVADDGGPYDLTVLRDADRECRRICGIQQSIRPLHNWRHIYATHLREQGVPVEEISQLLGHKLIATTQGYLGNFSLEHLQNSVHSSHPFAIEDSAKQRQFKVV